MPKRQVDVNGYERVKNGHPETVRDYIQMREAAAQPAQDPKMLALRRNEPKKRAKKAKARLHSIRIRREYDEAPDLEFYGEYAQFPKGDFAIDRQERGDQGHGEFRYFNPPEDVDTAETAEALYKRMEDYNRGGWAMVGIFVEAEILVPGGLYDSKGEPVMTTQTIRSPGLWGIESDSEQSYFREVAGEEIDALIDQLTALGISRSQIEKAQVDDKEIR